MGVGSQGGSGQVATGMVGQGGSGQMGTGMGGQWGNGPGRGSQRGPWQRPILPTAQSFPQGNKFPGPNAPPNTGRP